MTRPDEIAAPADRMRMYTPDLNESECNKVADLLDRLSATSPGDAIAQVCVNHANDIGHLQHKIGRMMSGHSVDLSGIERDIIVNGLQLVQAALAPAEKAGDDAEDEAYEIGKRDGYADAIQELDLATGGDGEFKGSTLPGGTVDVPAMKQRIISRICDAQSYADLRASGGIFPEAYAATPTPPSADVARKAQEPGFIKPDTDRQVFFYEQDFYVLSNFSAFALQWDGWRFDTSEAAYHYEKFKDCAPNICEIIRSASSAHEAFKSAELWKHDRRPDWDDVKVDVMRRILRAKVEQHEYVRRKLLATGDRELIEDSWRDGFWGWGPNRDGRNMLGKLWMEIRAELQSAAQGGGTEGGEV